MPNTDPLSQVATPTQKHAPSDSVTFPNCNPSLPNVPTSYQQHMLGTTNYDALLQIASFTPQQSAPSASVTFPSYPNARTSYQTSGSSPWNSHCNIPNISPHIMDHETPLARAVNGNFQNDSTNYMISPQQWFNMSNNNHNAQKNAAVPHNSHR
ncbi:17308_t:CDS:1 [Dentiscutata heterogama]|uniref:17308_t:CDS:1 n=1 Tax=Dentiscutata heterogama TaxID=1316150 RepID=A0ACA9JW46_9GLOM|nr:17308_t:CDS:1 [Dentiscutata heterogama]